MKQFFKLSITSVFVAGILLSAHVVEAIPTYEDACQVPLISRGLSAGSQNEDVLDLQNFLIQQKYLAPSAVSGYFGPLTRQAVRDFQRANNIVSSGTAAAL